eukprot:339178-Alexandrium_andersonii.AAC.1
MRRSRSRTSATSAWTTMPIPSRAGSSASSTVGAASMGFGPPGSLCPRATPPAGWAWPSWPARWMA